MNGIKFKKIATPIISKNAISITDNKRIQTNKADKGTIYLTLLFIPYDLLLLNSYQMKFTNLELGSAITINLYHPLPNLPLSQPYNLHNPLVQSHRARLA